MSDCSANEGCRLSPSAPTLTSFPPSRQTSTQVRATVVWSEADVGGCLDVQGFKILVGRDAEQR